MQARQSRWAVSAGSRLGPAWSNADHVALTGILDATRIAGPMTGTPEHAPHRADEEGIRISPFPPIGDYAFLSDCETTALIAPSGNVEWLCLPRMDSPSVFGSILDRDAGGFRVGPADVHVPAARRYVPGTMVLETSWETRMGWVIV